MARGTVALLEVCRSFFANEKKPLRSIVFAWVTAEEKGLIGSEYYTLNPVFRLKRHCKYQSRYGWSLG
jgi:Zn-dependent M28 family amino/carboxypeptidase